MKLTVLGSGSTGNAVLISTEKTNVLIDAGLSARVISADDKARGDDLTRSDEQCAEATREDLLTRLVCARQKLETLQAE